jgi:hypothetical protein
MSHNAKLPRLSPSAIASGCLEHQLVEVLANFRQRLRKHVIQTSLGTAFMSGIGAFSFSPLGGTVGAWQIPGAINANMLAVIASFMNAAALYQVMRQQELWLDRAVSSITHNNIGLLSVLGKLTELRSGETSGHNLHVNISTLLFAETLALPPDEIMPTVTEALLYDTELFAPGRSIPPSPDLGQKSAAHRVARGAACTPAPAGGVQP